MSWHRHHSHFLYFGSGGGATDALGSLLGGKAGGPLDPLDVLLCDIEGRSSAMIGGPLDSLDVLLCATDGRGGGCFEPCFDFMAALFAGCIAVLKSGMGYVDVRRLLEGSGKTRGGAEEEEVAAGSSASVERIALGSNTDAVCSSSGSSSTMAASAARYSSKSAIGA
jgi:hypothetical protein